MPVHIADINANKCCSSAGDPYLLQEYKTLKSEKYASQFIYLGTPLSIEQGYLAIGLNL